MSNINDFTCSYDPDSLRNTIRMALGDRHTKELEEALFWPLARFNQAGIEHAEEKARAEIRKALGL
ncbi:MAG: hypothetical protein C5B54_10240 [Acidobacteria bacterium]|nr:MAG: hypothetical protein C5B54_10240 [Acidobacteriota bacterium]